MSIIIKNSEKVIIDRTLPEVVKKLKEVDGGISIKFLTMLKDLGVNMIEVDRDVLNKIRDIPKNLDYIYRIEDASDIYFMDKYKIDIKYAAIDYKKSLTLNENALNILKDKKIMLEVDIKILDEFYEREDPSILDKLNLECLRIKHVVKYNICGWKRLINNIKEKFHVKVDMCADSIYCMATAISIEACMDGADSVTAAFNGQIYGLASLEEVIVGLKVIKNGKVSGNLKLIGEIAEIYTELTHEKVYRMKAVIGEDIFKYESGIHVDGIEKNPVTYEPYNPYDIGEKRTMYIGKHSGRKAIIIRLNELNIDCGDIDMDAFLKKVRELSIKLKRNIFDDELIQIYNDFKNTCLR
ncbi:MAG: homocitrate synthase [Clostridium sp.]|jgi:homocitrate synthase NifV|uniref:homocitrate synthase/isopropylmalate synthase family protein n=1 Tax=Clostridium sp. TaxID=1506 RepID=UPI0025B87A76|nr:homocitrate synthase [Clostridium sp.]MCH3965553.1 homocitrate synthase [Clostridium sp.]MCI1716881.1 homocitrate synthase [Clostridium sp.]MCI1801189.1 homocitrate synthase [Clostridium sp.]MCI1815067.1 homocitrate synthase [Clostridium sp.]MCI1871970.1 homocitrate synthase [Clostridium sp.]